MIRTMDAAPQGGAGGGVAALLVFLLLAFGLYVYLAGYPPEPPVLLSTATGSTTGVEFSYDVTTTDLTVDWSAEGGGGDFDPRGKCPRDFFSAGFVVLCKQVGDGRYFKFLYHKGKNLLYRIDREVIRGQARIGLHWVENTRFNARYRIADDAFRGGKSVPVPNAQGGTDARTFHYGEAVSKKRVQPGRELFGPTHVRAGKCAEWNDVWSFLP